MCIRDRYEDAIDMVTALARLFRISLSKGKNIITVAQELQHAENYLIIQLSLIHISVLQVTVTKS